MIALLRHGKTGWRRGDLAWRPGGAPGVYACRAAEAIDKANTVGITNDVVAELEREPWAANVALHGGYLTVTITREALAQVAVDVVRAGPDCVNSATLRTRTVPAAPRADLAAAPDWAHARAALVAELTASLAAAAGATLAPMPPAPATTALAATSALPKGDTTARYDQMGLSGSVAAVIAFAGEDAVRFALARTKRPDPAPGPGTIARHVLGNPAYAVRYAHAAAAAVLRWAGTEPGLTTGHPGEFRPRQLAEPGELALLDALSWLPERVAMAARRGRPDEFARYLETLASRTIDIMSTTGFKAAAAITSERLWLAQAARTGLSAGLGLLGIAAPDRI